MISAFATGSYFAGRSEAFQWEQEQRYRIEAVLPDIHEMLDIVNEEDADKLRKALRQLDAQTTYLAAYKDLLRPLNFAFLRMTMDLSHYRFQAVDPESGESRASDPEIEEIMAEGWRGIHRAALSVESKLRLSSDPYTLECIPELCDLAL